VYEGPMSGNITTENEIGNGGILSFAFMFLTKL